MEIKPAARGFDETSVNFKDAACLDPSVADGRAPQRKPLAGAYVALVLFTLVYYLRPEDWIPGFSGAPFAKFVAACRSSFWKSWEFDIRCTR